MNSKLYDTVKFIALILLPALGTLYAAVAGIWGLPSVEQVVGSIMAVDTFLGALIGISSAKFNASDAKFDGELRVHPDQAVMTFNNGGLDPDELKTRSTLQLKVVQKDEPAGISVPGAELPPVAPPV